MKRTAKAHWAGTFQNGNGEMTTQSKTLNNTAYSFKTRVEEGAGTNPEELLAAAHAACFTMAISHGLSEAGHTPKDLNTEAILEFDLKTLSITGIHLEFSAAKIENIDAEKMKEIAEITKKNCIISKALSVPITLSVNYSD